MIFRRVSHGVLYAVVIVAPLLFRSRSAWELPALEVLAAAGVAVWLFGMTFEGRLEWRRTPLDLPLGLLFAIVVLQVVVGNSAIARWALASGAEPIPPGLPVPFFVLGSVAPTQTKESLLLFSTYAAAFVLVVNGVRRRPQLERLIGTLLWLGAALSVFGLLDAMGRQFQRGWRDDVSRRVTATFVNTDHFAAFLNMLICLGIGYVIARHGALHRRASVAGMLRSAEGRERLIRHYFPVLAITPMVLGVIFTLSRAALLSLTLTLGVMLLVAGVMGFARRSLVLIGCLLVVGLGCAAWIGLGPLVAGLKRGAVDVHLRWILSVTSTPMVKDFPILGVGLGAYKDVYFRYRPAGLPPEYLIDYAHNDVLQMVVELGVVGAAVAVFGIWRTGRDFVGTHLLGRGSCPVGGGEGRWARRNDPFSLGITMGALSGVVTLGVHSLLDFPARVPANGILAAVCLGIAAIAIHTRFHSEAAPLAAARSVALPGMPASIAAAAIVLVAFLGFTLEAGKRMTADFRVRAAESAPGAAPAPYGVTRDVQALVVRGRQQLHDATRLWQTGATLDGRRFPSLDARRHEAMTLLTASAGALRDAIALAPSNPYFHESLGWAYASMASIDPETHQPGTARTHFLRAIALAPNDANLYRALLSFVASRQEPGTDVALWTARTGVTKNPALLPEFVYELLAFPLTDGEWLATVPETATDRIALAAELERRNLAREARYAYTQAVAVATPAESPFVGWMLANFLIRDRDVVGARGAVEMALKSAPDNAELHLTLARVLATTGDPDALDIYRLAVAKAEALQRRQPKDFPLFETKEPRAAAMVKAEVGRLDRPVVRYRRALAAYLTKRKLWEPALEEWNAVVAATPEDAAAYFGRGTIHEALGRGEPALEDYRKAVALDGRNASYRVRLAQRLWDTDQYFQAIDEWRAALGADPDDLNTHLALARASLKVGDKSTAFAEYNRVALLDPGHAEARRALTQLLRDFGRIP